MGDVIRTAIVTSNSVSKFFNDLKECVDSLQDEGLSVEVQYQLSTPYHSAVILGRAKEERK